MWWAEPTIRYRIKIVSCDSAKITLDNEINVYHRLKSIPTFSEVGGIWGLGQL